MDTALEWYEEDGAMIAYTRAREDSFAYRVTPCRLGFWLHDTDVELLFSELPALVIGTQEAMKAEAQRLEDGWIEHANTLEQP